MWCRLRWCLLLMINELEKIKAKIKKRKTLKKFIHKTKFHWEIPSSKYDLKFLLIQKAGIFEPLALQVDKFYFRKPKTEYIFYEKPCFSCIKIFLTQNNTKFNPDQKCKFSKRKHIKRLTYTTTCWHWADHGGNLAVKIIL